MTTYDKQSIPAHMHAKMKLLAQQRNRPIIREYELAIESWIAQENQNIILADSKLEGFLNDRLGKMEERLAGLNARVGMDVAIILMGVLHTMSQKYDIPEDDLYEQLRPAASKYFSRPLKK